MSVTLAWTLLFIAGVLEIGWAVGLKFSDGFTRLGPSLATLTLMAISILALSWAVKALPVGTAYAVWTGIGAVGTAVVGIWVLGEPMTLIRLGSIFLILLGIAGLKIGG